MTEGYKEGARALHNAVLIVLAQRVIGLQWRPSALNEWPIDHIPSGFVHGFAGDSVTFEQPITSWFWSTRHVCNKSQLFASFYRETVCQ